MMMNRLTGLVQQRGPPPGPEYYVLRSIYWTVLVSRDTAQSVMRQLQRWRVPRWICVVDVSGSEIWLPSASIQALVQSTPAQREADRKLRRQLDAEEEDTE